MTNSSRFAWSRSDFEKRLRDKGRYCHIYHPYQVTMNAGDARQTDPVCSKSPHHGKIEELVSNRVEPDVDLEPVLLRNRKNSPKLVELAG
ncbi:MAG: hypothetical protein GY806_06000 [Gammaproteobacteria bacterium]|nr:hypothetical protein [Gammaproteobacteria bacterium]